MRRIPSQYVASDSQTRAGWAAAMSETVSGVIERITFHNLDNGYCVLRVTARGHREAITVVGHMPTATAGEFIEATGDWVNDRNFGQQFRASRLQATPPHTTAGIARYLGSGLVKGIGPRYAQKIVDVFGDKTLEVIDQSPTFLSQVKGIGPKRIERIRASWAEQKYVRAIMVFLQSYGIGTARAVRIYKTYGENAIELVRANPYRLSTDIWGIGFRTADELAQQLGIPSDSPLRARAAVRHVLREASGHGHVAFPELLTVEQTSELTGIAPEAVNAAIEALRIDEEIIRERMTEPAPGQDDPFADAFLYLKPLFLAELGVARAVVALRTGAHPLPQVDVERALAWVESKMGIAFADAQREAVRAAVTEKFLILTGGPGTGKTTIVRAIIEIFAAKNLRLALCAPTGRAAKRLTESTGREAKTIHRLLEFDAASGNFRRGKENPLDIDLLVVDESSMMDVVLANQLLRAVPPWASLLLVGDIDQLPSVGAGCVLNDLIASGAVGVARLTEVHRQAGASWIIRAAHAVNQGQEPESAPAGGGDFYFVEAPDPPAVIEKLLTMVKERIPARFGLDPLRDVQILSPQVRTELGVLNLNKVLQEAVNPVVPGTKEVQRYSTIYRTGDKVIQTQNNYQREVYNGDIGRVLDIDAVEQFLTVDFDGRPVEYDFGDLDELQLAYAITIHKSQGGEYPAVVIPIHTQHYMMLQRNLLYTGITRGKKLVVLVGSRKALWRAVTNADTARRFSLLAQRIRTLLPEPTD
ncbi:MAG: ATP-dependent RecD-like DNA helicase [Bacteroidales bacterium]|nr:ATP-dependent RecD-like DNA helicase [Bacteroidales bacterium]